MIVEFKQENNKNFEELSDGTVFGYAGDFYIKMAYDLNTEKETFNAVNLEDGFPAFFGDDDEVTKYPKAKMYIE